MQGATITSGSTDDIQVDLPDRIQWVAIEYSVRIQRALQWTSLCGTAENFPVKTAKRFSGSRRDALESLEEHAGT